MYLIPILNLPKITPELNVTENRWFEMMFCNLYYVPDNGIANPSRNFSGKRWKIVFRFRLGNSFLDWRTNFPESHIISRWKSLNFKLMWRIWFCIDLVIQLIHYCSTWQYVCNTVHAYGIELFAYANSNTPSAH